MKPCRLVSNYWCFGGDYYPHPPGKYNPLPRSRLSLTTFYQVVRCKQHSKSKWRPIIEYGNWIKKNCLCIKWGGDWRREGHEKSIWIFQFYGPKTPFCWNTWIWCRLNLHLQVTFTALSLFMYVTQTICLHTVTLPLIFPHFVCASRLCSMNKSHDFPFKETSFTSAISSSVLSVTTDRYCCLVTSERHQLHLLRSFRWKNIFKNYPTPYVIIFRIKQPNDGAQISVRI